MQDLDIQGKGKHNVVFVATTNNSVYAFDADTKESQDSPGTDTTLPLWGPVGLNLYAEQAVISDYTISCASKTVS